MRAIWSGSVAFGLVSVPVKLYSATESHDVDLHQVHDSDGGRIRYQRRCEKCGKVVAYENIDRAHDDGTTTVVLSDDDFAALPAGRSKEIEVVEFVPSAQVDPLRFDKSYFLEPDGRGAKAYTLLRRTLESTDRTAIVRFTLRQRTRLGALRVHGDVLVLQGLLWDDEVRRVEFDTLTPAPTVSAKELELAAMVVAQLEDDFDPADYVDEYQEQLRALIDAKHDKGEAVPTEAPSEDEGGEVLDLMEALRRSVARKKGEGAASGTKAKAAEADGTPGTAKKAPAKKPATKKAPAKKTPATKPAGKGDEDKTAAATARRRKTS